MKSPPPAKRVVWCPPIRRLVLVTPIGALRGSSSTLNFRAAAKAAYFLVLPFCTGSPVNGSIYCVGVISSICHQAFAVADLKTICHAPNEETGSEIGWDFWRTVHNLRRTTLKLHEQGLCEELRFTKPRIYFLCNSPEVKVGEYSSGWFSRKNLPPPPWLLYHDTIYMSLWWRS